MNYINISNTGLETLNINTNLEGSLVATQPIAWTIKQDGNDSNSATFVSPSTNFNMFEFSYYQRLVCNFTDEGISLNDEVHYLIEGISNGKVIYRGKFFTTSKDLNNFSVNEEKYTVKASTNNYTILD